MKKQRSIVIIGGGLSGLALGAYIKDGGFNCIVIEKSDQVGGVLKTIQKDGYLLELGANTASSNLEFEELIRLLNIEDQVIRAEASASKRYILKKNKLKSISPKPKDILLSSLLSTGGKLRAYKEQSIKATQDFQEETVGQFFERRFGKEVVETIIDPMIGGIYSGDPYQLSIKSVFPQLLDYEQEHGSIIKALKKKKGELPKREIIGFKHGMQTLIKALEDYIEQENIILETEVTNVTPLPDNRFQLSLIQNNLDLQIEADVVVFATPSYVTAKFIHPISPELAGLMNLPHPKVGVLHLGYDQSAFKKPFQGFGFLNPSKEKKHFLGAISNSSFLPNRAPNGKQLFTLFLGGTKQEHLLSTNTKDTFEKAIQEFEEIMGAQSSYEFREEFVWSKGIPQFTLGHQQMLEGFEFFEKNTSNIHILGNFRSGLSLADCIKGAKKAHGTLIKDYSRQSYKEAISK